MKYDLIIKWEFLRMKLVDMWYIVTTGKPWQGYNKNYFWKDFRGKVRSSYNMESQTRRKYSDKYECLFNEQMWRNKAKGI